MAALAPFPFNARRNIYDVRADRPDRICDILCAYPAGQDDLPGEGPPDVRAGAPVMHTAAAATANAGRVEDDPVAAAFEVIQPHLFPSPSHGDQGPHLGNEGACLLHLPTGHPAVQLQHVGAEVLHQRFDPG